MKTFAHTFFLFFLCFSCSIIAQVSPHKYTVETSNIDFWDSRINTQEIDKSILYEYKNGHDSLWLEEQVFLAQPKIDFNDNLVWYDEVYLPTYNSWKYFELLSKQLKGGYLGTFNFIQRENYSYKTSPSHFEYEAGKADVNLIFNEKLKNEILSENYLPDYLVIGHPQLADINVITPNSYYKRLSGLGTTSLSGVYLLDSRSFIGWRAGYKLILAKRWMIEPSINYVMWWNEYTIPNMDGQNHLSILERIPSFFRGQRFANLRFGFCLF